MSGKRKPRRSRPGGVTALDRLLARLNPAPARPIMAFYAALEMVARHEHPGEAEWRDLADVVNHVETLMLAGHLVREEVAPLVAAGTEAMAAAARRWRAGDGMRLDAPGLQAMRQLVQVYDVCTEGLPGEVMAAARLATADRLLAFRRGCAPAGTEVIEV